VLTILDVRYALLLAILAAVFELIPVFGPILSAIPAVGIAFVDGGTTLALIVVGAFVIIQQFENHLLYPLVVTKVVGVPPLLIILALIVGATLAGFLGIILSVPAAAIVHELVRDIEKDRKAKLQPTGQL
jgi:predicted PurR-regulated permease PerM